MIDDRNQYEKTKAWLKANQVSSDNNVFNDHRHAIVASSDPYGLFSEVISEGKRFHILRIQEYVPLYLILQYHYCNGELIYSFQKSHCFV